MTITPKMVLLVGENTRASVPLRHWLCKRGCRCHFAASFHEACRLLTELQFDVVLSQYQLPDRTAFPLLDWLAGSPTTLFLSTSLKTGALWLPILDHGERCVGAPLLRSAKFTSALAIALSAETSSNELDLVAPDPGLDSLVYTHR